MEQRQLSERESQSMIQAQMSLDEKSSKADFVIENSGSLGDTKSQIKHIHEQLTKSNLHWKIRIIVGLAIGSLVGFGYYVVRAVTGNK